MRNHRWSCALLIGLAGSVWAQDAPVPAGPKSPPAGTLSTPAEEMDCHLIDKNRRPATMSRDEYKRMKEACDKAAREARPDAPAAPGDQPNTDEQGLPKR